jgi:DNA-binding beta-propeller fold protein YncE
MRPVIIVSVLSVFVLSAAGSAQVPVGAIYITDTDNHRIVRINDMTGSGWIAFGTKGSGANQFLSPIGIFVDTAGQIYVTDTGNHRIVRINDMSGTGWTVFEGTAQQKFDQPVGIFVGGGRIYVTDGVGRVVRMNDMTGAGWATYGTPASVIGAPPPGQFGTPYGIFFDAGRIYIGDAGVNRVARINDFSGAGWVEFGLPVLVGNLPGQLARPEGIFVDTTGRIYVADAGNHRIARINDMSGAGWATFGSRGNRPGELGLPSSVFVSSTGRIYIVDAGNNRIVRINDMSGEGWVALGAQGAAQNQFNLPRSIFVR